MQRVVRSGVLHVALAATLLSIPVLNAQQKSKDVPAAPVPVQITEAKKVFIANAGQENNPQASLYSGGLDRTYNQFYSALKNWGHYELVPSPADCDLVLEVRFTDALVGRKVFNGTSYGAKDDPQFRLVIMDPKTKIALWAFTEHVESARSQANRDKNFDQAMARIVDDVKNLVGQPATATANTQK